MATARGTLTLVCDNTPTTTLAAATATPHRPRPVHDLVRDAANHALANPGTCEEIHSIIETTLEQLHNKPHARAAAISNAVRAAFTAGYRAAFNDDADAVFADDEPATVTYLNRYRGGAS